MTKTLDQIERERREQDYETEKAAAGKKASEWPKTYDEAVSGLASQIEASTKEKAEQIKQEQKRLNDLKNGKTGK